jgi:2-octaprenyl-6-methoxyphenol hydroxylase
VLGKNGRDGGIRKVQDVLIVGAGPVGMMAALLLKKAGAQVLVLEKRKNSSVIDGRYLALSQGSLQILESVLFPLNIKLEYEPILQVHTSVVGHFPRVLMDRRELNLPQLGGVLSYSHLIDTLVTALKQVGVEIRWGCEVIDVVSTQEEVTTYTNVDETIKSNWVIRAEGGVFERQVKKDIYCDYEQSAVVCVMEIEGVSDGRAFERITSQGPIALLPIGNKRWVSIWSLPNEFLSEILALSDNEYLGRLKEVYRGLVDTFLSVSLRQVFVLGLNVQEQQRKGREFFLGNAAQTIHPVAGQGFNLGLRDVVEWVNLWKKSPSLLLSEYVALREKDRENTIKVTHKLVNLFKQPNWVERTLLSVSLFGAASGPVKRILMNQMIFGKQPGKIQNKVLNWGISFLKKSKRA